jgi:hypothetical protein
MNSIESKELSQVIKRNAGTMRGGQAVLGQGTATIKKIS